VSDPAPGTRPELLSDLLERHRAALEAFIGRRLGAALRGRLEAQDIAQEVAVRVLRDPPPAAADPFGWLCRLAEQCIVDGHRHFAAAKRSAGRERPGNVPAGEDGADLVALLTASMTTPTQAVVRNERRRRLEEALASLPGEQQEAVRLRYGEGLATREIATRLGKTDVAVRVLLSRTIQYLRDLLDSTPPG
jgi:RNA polymerase sigma-70 factor (ECF subfamily)